MTTKRKPAASRKAKTTAQEAISGIAAAMQGMETEPTGASLGGAEGAADDDDLYADYVPEPNAAPNPPNAKDEAMWRGIQEGDQVKVVVNDDTRLVVQRHNGKIGTVKERECEFDAYSVLVAFKGRNGGLAQFNPKDLEIVTK